MTDEKTPEPEDLDKPEESEEPQAQWQYKEEFGINTHMREVIELTVKVAESEIAKLRKKIDKLTYGV